MRATIDRRVRKPRQRHEGMRGASLVEAAMLLPLLVLLTAGMAQYSIVLMTSFTLRHALSEGLRPCALSDSCNAHSRTTLESYIKTRVSREATVKQESLQLVKASSASGTLWTLQYAMPLVFPLNGRSTYQLTEEQWTVP